MSLFHRSLGLSRLPLFSRTPPRLCLSPQPFSTRCSVSSTAAPSSLLCHPLCSRPLSSLPSLTSHPQPFSSTCRNLVTFSRIRFSPASISALPHCSPLRTGPSSHFSSSASSSPRSYARYPLRYLLLLGFTSASACFILGWYSHTALHLYLHDLLPLAPSTSLPSSFSSSSIDVLGYRLPLPVAAILAINVALCAAWHVPSLQPLMYLHFTTDFYRVFHLRMYHTLVTHAFSHMSGMHLLFNCMAFATIAPSISLFLSDSQFVAFYLGSAAISALVGFGLLYLTSLPANRLKQLRIPSLGASGAVFACFAASALAFPDSQYNILFIPYNIPASTILPLAAFFDVCGLVYNRYRGSPLGHGAHLGGMMCGVLLYKLWIERSALLKRVREERERRRKMWAQISGRGR